MEKKEEEYLNEKFKELDEETKTKINFKNSMLAFFGIIILVFFYVAYSKGTISLNENKEVLNILKYSKNYLDFMNKKISEEEMKTIEEEIKENAGYTTISFFKKEQVIVDTKYLINLIKKIKINNEEKVSETKINSLLENVIKIINNNYDVKTYMTIHSYKELISLIEYINNNEEDMVNKKNKEYVKEKLESEKNELNKEIKKILKND